MVGRSGRSSGNHGRRAPIWPTSRCRRPCRRASVMGRNGSLVLPGVARPIRTGAPPDRADAAEVVDQAGLADARLAGEHHQPAAAVGGCLQHAREHAPLDVATDAHRAGSGMHPLILPLGPVGLRRRIRVSTDAARPAVLDNARQTEARRSKMGTAHQQGQLWGPGSARLVRLQRADVHAVLRSGARRDRSRTTDAAARPRLRRRVRAAARRPSGSDRRRHRRHPRVDRHRS